MENLQIIPIPKDVQPQYVEMKVPLYSHGCERKVKTSLSHLKGIYSVQVHCDDQKVTVWGICSKEAVLAAVKKKRRGAHFWDQEEDDAGKEGGAPAAEETAGQENTTDEHISPPKARGKASSYGLSRSERLGSGCSPCCRRRTAASAVALHPDARDQHIKPSK
ncbi:unnamed protein product [Spirodela intermedia]|uniref:HMA domain-containing protein n=1 Tax=Spirodela intermedia TaxID=51605 RepID=A0A7I8L0L0_SPIIN|nr:unnamed protein product [Spirodela intermedia]